MHQGNQVFSLGRVSLTCTGPGQLNHIKDNPHVHAKNNPSTRLGLAWTQTHNRIKAKVTAKRPT